MKKLFETGVQDPRVIPRRTKSDLIWRQALVLFLAAFAIYLLLSTYDATLGVVALIVFLIILAPVPYLYYRSYHKWNISSAKRGYILDEHEVERWVTKRGMERMIEGSMASKGLSSKRKDLSRKDEVGVQYNLDDGLTVSIYTMSDHLYLIDPSKVIIVVEIGIINAKNLEHATTLYRDLGDLPLR